MSDATDDLELAEYFGTSTPVLEARIDELEKLLSDWDMAERDPGDDKVHEYINLETINDRLATLKGEK